MTTSRTPPPPHLSPPQGGRACPRPPLRPADLEVKNSTPLAWRRPRTKWRRPLPKGHASGGQCLPWVGVGKDTPWGAATVTQREATQNVCSLGPSVSRFGRRWRLHFRANVLDAFVYLCGSRFGLFRSKRPFPGRWPSLSLCRVMLPLMSRGAHCLPVSVSWEGLNYRTDCLLPHSSRSLTCFPPVQGIKVIYISLYAW